MTDLEAGLRTLLKEMADEMDRPSELSRRTRRRALMGRFAAVVGGSALFLSVIVGGVAGVGALTGKSDNSHTEGPASSATTHDGHVITNGESNGYEWVYRAYLEGDALCGEFLASYSGQDVNGSGTIVCPAYRPERTMHMTAGLTQAPGRPRLLHGEGWVSREVVRLVLVSEVGERDRVNLIPAEKETGLSVSFFVLAPLDPEGGFLIAYDKQRDELGCWTLTTEALVNIAGSSASAGMSESAVTRGC